MPRGIHKRLSAIDFGLRTLHAKSLRSRSFRASMDSRLKALAAETKEALQVALEVGNLVRFSISSTNLSTTNLTWVVGVFHSIQIIL